MGAFINPPAPITMPPHCGQIDHRHHLYHGRANIRLECRVAPEFSNFDGADTFIMKVDIQLMLFCQRHPAGGTDWFWQWFRGQTVRKATHNFTALPAEMAARSKRLISAKINAPALTSS